MSTIDVIVVVNQEAGRTVGWIDSKSGWRRFHSAGPIASVWDKSFSASYDVRQLSKVASGLCSIPERDGTVERSFVEQVEGLLSSR